jgi:hypothetical protein
MQVQYGSYVHPDNECSIAISRQGIFERGICTKIKETWTVEGIINITGVQTISDITARIYEIENAYLVNGLDISLVGTAHLLQSARCLGGTRVVNPPQFPKGDGTEYATVRTFSVTVEGDILLPAGMGGLIEWKETLEFTGGGPRWVIIETRRGAGERQQVSEQVPYRVRQSGSAVGVTAWPIVPGPLFPAAEHVERRVLARMTPERMGNDFTAWPVSWNYEFESVSALSGNPTIL